MMKAANRTAIKRQPFADLGSGLFVASPLRASASFARSAFWAFFSKSFQRVKERSRTTLPSPNTLVYQLIDILRAYERILRSFGSQMTTATSLSFISLRAGPNIEMNRHLVVHRHQHVVRDGDAEVGHVDREIR